MLWLYSVPSSLSSYMYIHELSMLHYVAPGGMFPTSCSPVNCNMYTHVSHSGWVISMLPKL